MIVGGCVESIGNIVEQMECLCVVNEEFVIINFKCILHSFLCSLYFGHCVENFIFILIFCAIFISPKRSLWPNVGVHMSFCHVVLVQNVIAESVDCAIIGICVERSRFEWQMNGEQVVEDCIVEDVDLCEIGEQEALDKEVKCKHTVFMISVIMGARCGLGLNGDVEVLVILRGKVPHQIASTKVADQGDGLGDVVCGEGILGHNIRLVERDLVPIGDQ